MSTENLLELLTGSAFSGVGKATAAKAIARFGHRLGSLLDEAKPAPFLEVMTEKKARALLLGWASHKEQLAVMQWLDAHGVEAELGRIIWRVWGQDSVAKLKGNPYRLLAFSSWAKVDRLAAQLGVAIDSPARLVAIAEQAAYTGLDEGHTLITEERLVKSVIRLLPRNATESIEAGLSVALAIKAINAALETGALLAWGDGYQVPGAHFAERFIESWFTHRQAQPLTTVDVPAWLNVYQREEQLLLSDEQVATILNATTAPVSAFFGGAGVGKTFTLKAVCDASETLLGKRPVLLALAAKAVRRLSEATSREAMTLARCLYRFDAKQLSNTIVIIDEASMIGLLDFRNLLKKLPETSHLVIVGDPAQLPSIGAGNVLYDLLQSDIIPTQELTQVHRFADQSSLPETLRLVRQGVWPELPAFDWQDCMRRGVFLLCVPLSQIHRTCALLLSLYGSEAQIINPQVRGRSGARSLNSTLQREAMSEDEWVPGTRVIFTANKRLSNGDEVVNGLMGRVQSWRVKKPRSDFAPWLTIGTDQGLITVTLGEAKSVLELGWAISVHKSQGSEWDTVVVVLPPHSMLLDRSMIYTALSRCRSRCICVVPDVEAVRGAVKGLPVHHHRVTGLFSAFRRP